jgi:predicted neuraminidase
MRFRPAAGVILVLSLAEVAVFPQTSPGIAPSSDGVILREFVADPSPTPQCHAATIAESHGHLVAAWFGGEYEGHPGVGIWLALRDSGGWTAPAEIAVGTGKGGVRYPCWNPVLFQPVHGPLMLFYKVGLSPSTWRGMLMTSSDGGRSWGHERRLPDGIIGPVKNKPVECPEGTLVCPSSSEDHGWQVKCETTVDGGRSWSSSGALNDTLILQAIQPAFVRRRGGGILAFGRTKQQRMFVMRSLDCGASWSAMTLSSLRNPNSGLDAVGLQDGRLLVVFNDASGSAERWDAGRDVLALAVSDDGERWRRVLTIEDEAGSEFSYPSVIQTSDGLLHIVYTWKRTKVAHVVIDPFRLSDSSR